MKRTTGQALADPTSNIAKAAATLAAARAERLARAERIARSEGITLDEAIRKLWAS